MNLCDLQVVVFFQICFLLKKKLEPEKVIDIWLLVNPDFVQLLAKEKLIFS